MSFRRITFAAVIAALGHIVLHGQTFTPVTTGPPVSELGAWRSVNWVDYDRDGYLDLLVTRGKAGGQDNVLYRNDGPPNYTFSRMSGLVISQDHEPSDGSTWADYDNDGYLDCFVANWYNHNNLMYHNNAGGSFTRITSGAQVNNGGYSETASWGDYNNDGLVDLYVANSAGLRINFLYKNTGGGQFERITTGAPATDAKSSRGVNWVDYDDDGDLDLFVANENGETSNLYRNMLTETGVDTFARVSGDTLVTSRGSGWSGSWGDIDNDGDQDVFVVNSTDQHSSLFLNNGNGSFMKFAGEPFASDSGWGATAAWADIDNDGDLDLIVTHAYASIPVTNYLYRNLLMETDTAKFQRILTGPVVTDPGYMYGLSWGDYDEDGDLDLFVARTFCENQTNAFYRNDGNANHWLTLDLRGKQSNAAAIGAKVRVKATISGKPVWQLRVVEGQSGYCGQNLQLHFGIGDAASIDSLKIIWPAGSQEIYTNVSPNRHLVIVENDSTPVALSEPPQGFLNHSVDPTLKWNRSLYFPPYRVQVATDSTFSTGIIADSIVTPDTLLRVPVNQNFIRYYWRVKSPRSIHPNLWSETGSFDNDITPPDAPTYSSPAGGGINIPVIATSLWWHKAANATAYHVRLSVDSLFNSIIIDSTLTDTLCRTPDLAYLTKYFWDVRGMNFVGTSPAGTPSSFTTIIQSPEAPVQSSPANGSTGQPFVTAVSWNPASRASTYQLQVATDSLFISLKLNDSQIVAESAIVQGLTSLTPYFWRVRAANAGGSSPFSPAWKFITMLGTPVLAGPLDSSRHDSLIALSLHPVLNAEGYEFQVSEDSDFAALVLDDTLAADTSTALLKFESNKMFYWRARGLAGPGAGSWSAGWRFFTTYKLYALHTETPWNLLSVPPAVPDLRAAAIFPSAISGPYRYANGSYVPADSLTYGEGYWVKLLTPANISIAGSDRILDTVEITQGWNLIGTVSVKVASLDITSVPAGIVTSPFYQYSGAYTAAETLRPGSGYWVYAGSPGQLILGAANSAVQNNRIKMSLVTEAPPRPPSPPRYDDAFPTSYRLDQNSPNPFNPKTTIQYTVLAQQPVTVTVYDLLGREVATLVNEELPPGTYRTSWEAGSMPSGVYYYRLRAGSYDDIKKMVLAK